MPLSNNEKEELESGIIDYIKARPLSVAEQMTATDNLTSLIGSLRPDMSIEVIKGIIRDSEPKVTTAIDNKIVDSQLYVARMLEYIDRRI